MLFRSVSQSRYPHSISVFRFGFSSRLIVLSVGLTLVFSSFRSSLRLTLRLPVFFLSFLIFLSFCLFAVWFFDRLVVPSLSFFSSVKVSQQNATQVTFVFLLSLCNRFSVSSCVFVYFVARVVCSSTCRSEHFCFPFDPPIVTGKQIGRAHV